MSLFQCEVCGCCENTALSCQGFYWMTDLFDWSYAPEREGKKLCSACGPTHYKSGKQSEWGVWHGRFPRVRLPLGAFKTDRQGNLAHVETGDTDYHRYEIQEPTPPQENDR